MSMDFIRPWSWDRDTNRVITGIFLGIALLVFVAVSWHFLPIIVDDALISYRYSERFLQGLGLTWNNGEYVEGYSNLLWVLVVAAGGLIQPNLIVVGKVLGIVANLAVLAAFLWSFARVRYSDWLVPAAGLFALLLSQSFAFWGIGGLETPLLEALVVWGLATAHRRPAAEWSWVLPGVLLGLAAITRPDGILFAGGTFLALLIRDGWRSLSFRRHISVIAIPLCILAAQVIFRLAYYGDYVPNTAYAKVAITATRLALGIRYVLNGSLVNCVPILAIFAISVYLWRSRQWPLLRQSAVFAIPGVIWLAYIGFVGGDWFPFFRLWIPALTCFAFALSALLTTLRQSVLLRLALVAPLVAALHFAFQYSVDPWRVQIGASSEVEKLKNTMRKDPAWARRVDPANVYEAVIRIQSECAALGGFLREAFGTQQPLVAMNAAGCLPYFSRLPSLDMLGLTDAHIARHRPSEMGSGILAHELGDGAYVLARKPDLVVLCTATGATVPCFRGETELASQDKFNRLYRLIRFRAGTVDAALWTRIEDGRLAIRRSSNELHIPGYLLASNANARAMLDENGRLGTKLDGGSASIDNVYLPAGRWAVSLRSTAATTLRLQTAPSAGVAQGSLGAVEVESDGRPLSFAVSGETGWIYGIDARKL